MKIVILFGVLGTLCAIVTAINTRRHQLTSSSYGSQSYSSNNTNNNTNNTQDFAAVVAQLDVATTAVERINILNNDADFIFDFLNPPQQTPIDSGKGGHLVTADRQNFPAVVGNGMAIAIGFIGPCGMNTPHIHPRATELNFAVNGSFLTGFIGENGARQVINTVKAGTVSIFPKGSIHYQANLGCDPVVFVASFNDEDPGVSQIAQNFFGLNEEVVSATLGGVSEEFLNKTASMIPANVALGLKTCLQKCGLSGSNKSSSNDGFNLPNFNTFNWSFPGFAETPTYDNEGY